jgi:hypothetical protein
MTDQIRDRKVTLSGHVGTATLQQVVIVSFPTVVRQVEVNITEGGLTLAQ